MAPLQIKASSGVTLPQRLFVHSASPSILRPAALPLPTSQRLQRHQQYSGSARPLSAQPISCTAHAATASAPCAEGDCSPSTSSSILRRAAALAVLFWHSAVVKMAALARRLNQPLEPEEADQVGNGIKSSMRDFRRMAVVMPLAAISNSSIHTILLLTRAVSSFIKLYLLLLFMRVLLSWFPTFNWEGQPWLALRQVTDPYLNLFRGLVPPLMGSIDFTPLFGFMILQYLGGILEIRDEEAEVW